MPNTESKTSASKIDANDKFDNPIGVNGFEFIEIATHKKEEIFSTFKTFGFQIRAKNPKKEIYLMTQGNVHLIINSEPGTFAYDFAKEHGHSFAAMGFRVKDSQHAFSEAVKRGAKPFEDESRKDLGLPAIYGVGGSLIYFVDDNGLATLYRDDYEPNPDFDDSDSGVGLLYIDHLDHNVLTGQLEEYEEFYTKIFNFREARYWELQGSQTGINSKAFISPCNKILIPVVQNSSGNSYVKEYLDLYGGPGIQHIAFYTADICHTIESLRAKGQGFMNVKDSYYEEAKERLPEAQATARFETIKKNRILIDGDGSDFMLQIFSTKDLMNPIFFEFIERGGYLGFGERNFPALFECLEEDQLRRGYLEAHK